MIRATGVVPSNGREAGEAPCGSVTAWIESGGLHSVYQPVVDVITGTTVGYEALARGQAGTPFEHPADMFAAARAQACVPELDAACRRAAVEGALAARLTAPCTLFINVEPGAVDGTQLLDPHYEAMLADGSLRLLLEFTERDLTSRPAEMLALVRHCRALGCGIALDDVGIDPRSLAFFPFLSPDVIKLDMRLVQDSAVDAARTIYAVAAEAERYGATVVAEGIETEAHREIAIAIGAVLGQGWWFGVPADLPSQRNGQAPGVSPVGAAKPRPPLTWRRSTPRSSNASPFELLSARRPVRSADKPLLNELSRQLEIRAGRLGPETVVLTEFQDVRFFAGLTARRYADLAPRVALVAAIAVGMPLEPAPGVRGTALEPDDPLAGGWTIAVISPHYAAAFAAVQVSAPGDGPDLYEFAITLDRELVIGAALTLMQRVIAN